MTRFNHDRLKELVERGPVDHPGARFIVREDGQRIDLRFINNRGELPLQLGSLVERHVQVIHGLQLQSRWITPSAAGS